MLNDAKASRNEVRKSGSESCRLSLLALHPVFQEIFLNSVVTDAMQCVLFPTWACQFRAHSAVPAPCPALLRHCYALLSAPWITAGCLIWLNQTNKQIFFFFSSSE